VKQLRENGNCKDHVEIIIGMVLFLSKATDVPAKTTKFCQGSSILNFMYRLKIQPILTAFQQMIWIANLLIMKTLHCCKKNSGAPLCIISTKSGHLTSQTTFSNLVCLVS
jgi:hypothetical protein